jgi:hypothetical protein
MVEFIFKLQVIGKNNTKLLFKEGNMTKHIMILMTLIVTTLVGCADKAQQPTNLTAGYWGQVNQLERLAPTSMYLLFVKPQDTYNVCVASHLIDEHPQIITEIDASIKIWGHYINREIQTQITQATIAIPPVSEHQDTTFKNYIDTCPDADIVVGYGNINSVGLTANRYSYSTGPGGVQVPHNTQRILLLQNPAFRGATWHSYYKESDPISDSEQLIATLVKRSQYQLLENSNEYATLPVLMHEFGHVWGLCDMYPLAGGHTNCHPIWSKKDAAGNILLVPNAKMAAAGWKNPLFLHDDDIEGIRTLASRNKYRSLWANQNSFPQVPVAQEADFLFKFKNTVSQQDSITFNFSLYSTKAIELNITLNSSRGQLSYRPMKLQGPVDTNQYGLRLGYPEGLVIKSLHVVINDEQGNQLVEVNSEI